MSAVKFHLDENVNPAVAEGLRLRGFDATTTVGQRLLRASDDKQLRVATAGRRALVSHDVTTLPSLHADWLAAGREHAGIILAPARPVGALVRHREKGGHDHEVTIPKNGGTKCRFA